MAIDVIDIISEKGTSPVNEDIAGRADNCIWVIDGATGVGDNHVDEISDARWYVSWWDKYLRENSNIDTSLNDLIRKGIYKVRNEYLMISKLRDIDKISSPSASIAVVRERNGELEFFVLGDCNIYIDANLPLAIKDHRVDLHDNKVYKLMRENMLFNLQEVRRDEESFMSVYDLLRVNRSLKNTDDGYWILGFDENAVEQSINGRMKLSSGVKFLLASDGFTCSIEKYGIFREGEVFSNILDEDLRNMVEKIRRFEGSSACSTFPRFKTMDDLSCVYGEYREDIL